MGQDRIVSTALEQGPPASTSRLGATAGSASRIVASGGRERRVATERMETRRSASAMVGGALVRRSHSVQARRDAMLQGSFVYAGMFVRLFESEE